MTFECLVLKPTDTTITAGAWLEWVPRVPGTHRILSSYMVAPLNFKRFLSKEMHCTHQNFEVLGCGTHELKMSYEDPAQCIQGHISLHVLPKIQMNNLKKKKYMYQFGIESRGKLHFLLYV